ncbi:Glutenin, high molecular weight subunit [Histomonas meleagridis]|uniref:Glutenin, high molecular weight subunit precursor-related protein n=1 Tax=Histomonas meleagridis TaxID=135588 RepID=UPI0035597F35|nr:Glutenin, high molecular weight subunit [Histomonas meleagridis]KAH0802050.1 Glutenin, high molecular weight subunit precursor-related protein [Histomonas meleagridis]
MYVKDFLKGQKILIVMLWSNELSPKEREFVNRKYIFQSSEKGYSECIKTAVDHFGIELVVVINYYDAIIELTKQTKPGYCDYYAVWVFCGPPYCILPKQDNPHADPNLVGQFNEVLIQYWQNGGSIVFWAEGDPLHYQVNLFLETAKFYELGNKCVEFRVGGEHIGKKILLGDETGKLSKNQTFNRSPQFFNKITRTSLAHNIGKIFEGITISFVESTGNITPFQPFSRDSDGGISSLYYPSNTSIGNGDIIIDCGYTKCFTEIRTDGTFRYIQNIAGWTARPEVHIRTNPGIKPNEWRPKAVYYNIQLGVKWNKFEKGYFGSFDIIYMVDATGSMGDYITAAKNECINISNELKVKLPNVDFQFGGIFYRDPVDSSSDVHQYFNLSYDVVGLQRQIGTVKADGGGDGPEDWVGAYTIALNNIRWRDGIKLIIHIADAPAHGKAYGGDTKHQVEEAKLKPLVQRCAQRGIKIIGMYINNYALPSYNQCQTEYNTMSNPDMMYKIQEFRAGSDISAYFKEAVVTAAIAAAAKE